MATYAGNPNLVFLAVERKETASLVQAWINVYGWNFPVGLNGATTIFQLYGWNFDTFFVIGPTGRVTFLEPYPNPVNETLPKLTQAIDEALATVPVEPLTWGRIKDRFR